MKKSLYFLGVVPIIILGSIFFNQNSNSQKSVYEPRTSSLASNGAYAQGMLEYYEMIHGDYSHEDYLRMLEEAKAMPVDRATMSWAEHGPDNIGGRCRAIVVDKDNINHVYAGSVSGGLFESINRGNFWTPVTQFDDNLAISSMCQTTDGTIFIATGHVAEQVSGYQGSGANGNGVYKRNSDGTFTHITGTENYGYINEVVCDTINNMVWIATAQGLKQYDPVNNALNNITNGLPGGACNTLAISPDGKVIVAGMSGTKTFVSVNSGSNFTDYSSSSNTSNPIGSVGSGRVEYAISHEKNDNDKYNVYASAANSFLTGIWMSEDDGVNWTRIAPANDQSPGSFAPFSTGAGSGQGLYDNIISVHANNPNKIYVGGIDLFSWGTNGNWTQLSQWFLPPQNSKYVHADIHELVWDKEGRLYIGSDGGVIVSDDGGQSFHPSNRGFNVTQFYAIGASAHGDLIGGSQDNGSLTNYHDNSTWHEFDEVGGGDGFSTDISFINRNILFSSIYYGGVYRSLDRGESSNLFVPTEFADVIGCTPGGIGTGCGSFFTNFTLWENPNDTNSEDSVSYIPSQAYSANDIVQVPSRTNQAYIDYVTPTDLVYDDTLDFDPGLTTQDSIITSIQPSNNYNLSVFNYSIVAGAHPLQAGDSVYLSSLDTIVEVDSISLLNHYYGTNPLRPGKVYDMGNEEQVYGVAWDTIIVQDPYQSWMAIGLGGGDGVWMTRNALRSSEPSNAWFKVNHSNMSGSITAMQYSRDGNHLFIGTSNGNLYRLSGFGNVYSPVKDVTNGDTLIDVTNVVDPNDLVTTWESVGGSFGGRPITGIGVEGDVDHVVVTLGSISGSGKVYESVDATAAAPTWSNIHGNLPSGAYYACVVDRNDPNLIVVGSETGVYCTDNGGSTWANVSGGIGNTPVYDLKQNWRTYDEGCLRPGEIYAGTHGRGIWSSEDFLNLPSEQDNLNADKFVPNINVYPNPMTNQGTLEFNLDANSDVTIRIFNLNGRLVREIKESNLVAGTNNVTFGVADLAKGTYIVQLQAGSQVETSKFVKR